MTEVRDFTAVYVSTIRKYNVYFYNEDVLLQTRENVSYGGGTSYTGATPTKLGVENPEEYVFKGWIPEPSEITGETYCYAFFKFTGYLFGKLNNDSEYGTIDNPNWELINTYWNTIGNDIELFRIGAMSGDEFFAKYPIGGRMLVPIYLDSGTVVADLEIIGHEHDNLSDGSGKSPLTFFCVDLPRIQHAMNKGSQTNSGGWKASDMRSFVNGELYQALPDELKSIIKTVDKISDGGSTNQTLVTTQDRCWIASWDEVGLASKSNSLPGQGSAYSAIFNNNNATRKKYITDDTEYGRWWLRSSYCNDGSSTFWRVTNSGSTYSDIAFNPHYVAFGFCI